MKPLIGLIPLVDDKLKSLWMLPGYMDGISHAGGIPDMLPLTEDPSDLEQLCAACDGFLLTGGHDVSPSVYGEEKLPRLRRLLRSPRSDGAAGAGICTAR